MAGKRNRTIKVFAPATVANLACGFDIMGLAIEKPGDVVELTPNTTGEIRIRRITGDAGKLSRDPLLNTVTVSIASFLQAVHSRQGFDIVLKKQMPLGSGMGSSAASSAAGAMAVNEFFGRPFTKEQLVPFAMEGERVACGTAHPDNVAPSLMGGVVLCHASGRMIPLPVPKQLYVVVLHPSIELLTRDSRNALPKKIALRDAVKQWSNTAALTAAFFNNDMDLLREAMIDVVAEPVRGPLIPGFSEIKEAAMKHALACSISGSGPSVFAMASGLQSAQKAGAAMQAVCRKTKIKSRLYISRINTSGAKRIS